MEIGFRIDALLPSGNSDFPFVIECTSEQYYNSPHNNKYQGNIGHISSSSECWPLKT